MSSQEAIQKSRDGEQNPKSQYLQVKPELFPSGGTEIWQGDSQHSPIAAVRSDQHPPQTHSISQSGSDLPGVCGLFPLPEEQLLWQ